MFAMRSSKGFTLIELMIVVAIVGILAAIAYPSYLQYVESTRRSDAQGALSGLASAMERHYTTNSSYKNAAESGDTGSPGIYPNEAPLDGSTKFYDLKIQAADDSSYVLRATPKNGQAGDGILELTSTGVKRWDKDNNGSFSTAENTWSK